MRHELLYRREGDDTIAADVELDIDGNAELLRRVPISTVIAETCPFLPYLGTRRAARISASVTAVDVRPQRRVRHELVRAHRALVLL